MLDLNITHDPRITVDKEYIDYLKSLNLYGYVDCMNAPSVDRFYNLVGDCMTPFRIITTDTHGVVIVPDIPRSKYFMLGLSQEVLNLYMYGIMSVKDRLGLGRIKTSGINIIVKHGYFKSHKQRILWLKQQTDKAIKCASKTHEYYITNNY